MFFYGPQCTRPNKSEYFQTLRWGGIIPTLSHYHPPRPKKLFGRKLNFFVTVLLTQGENSCRKFLDSMESLYMLLFAYVFSSYFQFVLHFLHFLCTSCAFLCFLVCIILAAFSCFFIRLYTSAYYDILCILFDFCILSFILLPYFAKLAFFFFFFRPWFRGLESTA